MQGGGLQQRKHLHAEGRCQAREADKVEKVIQGDIQCALRVVSIYQQVARAADTQQQHQ